MLKKIKFLIFSIITFVLFSFTSDNGYDPSLVEISSTTYNSDKFIMVTMKREGNRIKAKYFAATDPFSNKTVPERYKTWSVGKDIIAYSSGTYMTACEQYFSPKPVGLCIDNGVIVNKNLSNDLGGLVVVYNTGGIAASRLNDGDLKLDNNSSKLYAIKNNTFDRVQFIKWAEQNEATVFQAHLLVYKDKLDLTNCRTGSCLNKASRRFLAVCKDQNDKLVHIIIHCITETTLYDGTKKAYTFLKEFKDMKEVVFMVNLDTGCQNVFTLYKPDGSEKIIKVIGGNDFYRIEQAVNLLVYYYE